MTANDRLSKTIAMGRRRYIVRYGVLGWGLGTAALFTLLMFMRQEHLTPVQVASSFVLFPLGGYFWGTIMWATLKKRHERSTAR